MSHFADSGHLATQHLLPMSKRFRNLVIWAYSADWLQDIVHGHEAPERFPEIGIGQVLQSCGNLSILLLIVETFYQMWISDDTAH